MEYLQPKGFAIIPILVVVSILVFGGAYTVIEKPFAFQKNSADSKVATVQNSDLKISASSSVDTKVEQATLAASSSTTKSNANVKVEANVAVQVSDIDLIKESVNNLSAAMKNGDVAALKKYYSSATVKESTLQDIFTDPQYKSISFKSAKKGLNNYEVTLNTVKNSGVTSEEEFIFVKESGVWKMGFVETIEKIFAELEAGGPISVSFGPETSCVINGALPDLVITGITTNPSSPSVKGGEVVFNITIKNIGQGTYPCEPSISINLNKSLLLTVNIGSSHVPIVAGSSFEVKIPYDYQNAIVGANTVEFEILSSSGFSAKESDTINNKITKSFIFVE